MAHDDDYDDDDDDDWHKDVQVLGSVCTLKAIARRAVLVYAGVFARTLLACVPHVCARIVAESCVAALRQGNVRDLTSACNLSNNELARDNGAERIVRHAISVPDVRACVLVASQAILEHNRARRRLTAGAHRLQSAMQCDGVD